MEFYKALPFETNVKLSKHFQQYANDWKNLASKVWRNVEHLPLTKELLPTEWKHFRWIGKSDGLQKWYMSSVAPQLLKVLEMFEVFAMGFNRGCTVDDLVSIISGTIQGMYVQRFEHR